MRRNISFLILALLSQCAVAQAPINGFLVDGVSPEGAFVEAGINKVITNDVSLSKIRSGKPRSGQFLPYDQADIITQEQSDTLNYQLALAPYQKRQNRWQPEKAIRLQGRLYRETHELRSGFDEQDVYAFYRRQIPMAAELLFACKRRDCGESNNWANDHFRIKQLYGLDQYQFYSVHRLGDDQYITLYVVRRGNRRVYAHIETLVFQPIKNSQ